MGSLRDIPKQGRFQRVEPELSEATLTELRTFVIHSTENRILDTLTENGETLIGANTWWEDLPINNFFKLSIMRREIVPIALRNLLDGDAIEKVRGNDPTIEGAIYALRKRSELPDLQFKILKVLSLLGGQRRMTVRELKSELNHGHLANIRVKEIRESLKEMEKAGLVKFDGHDQWEKVDALA
ncbi:MAG: hypothetical protein ACLP5H_23650 [Desulfomonilaceae bacterium]